MRWRSGTPEVLDEIADSLGILPEAAERLGVKVAVAVEGSTDIDALISFAGVLTENGHLDGFDQTKVFWTIGGGSTLKDWVECRYLDRLGIPQIYLFDSDRRAANQPIPREKEDRVADINSRPNCRAFLSRKRTIENYIHPDAVARVSNGRITIPEDTDLDHGNIAATFGNALAAAKDAHGNRLGFYPEGHDGMRLAIATGETNCKKIITAYLMRHMTPQEIDARGAYTDPDTGEQHNEIVEWLSAIQANMQ